MAWTRNRPTGLTYLDASQAWPGYTLFSSVRGHHATLLDMEGQIVHQWHHPEGIQHLHVLDNGHLLIQTLPPADAGGVEKIGGSAGALVELDWDGNVVWEHRDLMMHHDYVRLNNGNTLYLAWDKLPQELHQQIQGGHSHEEDPEQMWADVVKEISPEGELVSEWRSWEHLDFADQVICPLESYKEWTHANSLALAPNGDWVISFRLTSVVVIVDQHTGAVTWQWGQGELSHQHNAQVLGNGNLLIFDNGCHRPRGPTYSRIVELNPESREIVWSYHAETMVAFYSFMVSGAQRLSNGNTLITEGASGRLFEVTSGHEIVWEYVSPWTLPSVFGPTPVVFRCYRYAADHPFLLDRDLDPGRYAELNARIAAGEILREPEYHSTEVSLAPGSVDATAA